MLIVGQVSSSQEAIEITLIVKHFIVGNRARLLGKRSRNAKS